MKNNSFKTLCGLTQRNMMVFLRNKMTCFLALLSPLIILMLFILFLKDVQIDTLNNNLAQFNCVIDKNLINGVVNGWFLSGVLSVGSITVALTSYTTMVNDRENKVFYDFVSSPIKNNIVKLSYFLASFFINLLITFIMCVVGLIYLAITKTFFLDFVSCLEIILNIILTCFCSSLIMLLIASLFKKESQLGSFTGILSGVIGFLIGAYMPTSMMPKFFQFISNIIPGSYSAGLFRNVFMDNIIDEMSLLVSPDAIAVVKEYFSLNIEVFGLVISKTYMYLILTLYIIALVIISILVFRKNKKDVK